MNSNVVYSPNTLFFSVRFPSVSSDTLYQSFLVPFDIGSHPLEPGLGD